VRVFVRLGDVTPVLLILAAAAEARGRTKGPPPPALPDDGSLPYPVLAPQLVGPTAVVSLDGPSGSGVLEVSGRIDPGERGLLWVRVLDAQGVAWEEAAVAAGTLEEPGWSTREWVGFYYASQFPVPPGPAFEATAEVWFHGASGSTRRLLALPVTVPSR
jgi:hypothetical protein